MTFQKVVALAGGVGGAKLADGLAQVLPPENLSIIVNIADDFRHYGLHISPDLDTIMYTLSRYANPETGWGVRDESWQMLEMLKTYGETPWFGLGDRDLATHLLRTHWLDQGKSLTQITQHLTQKLGILARVLPASDDRHATMLETDIGTLSFQDYFVRHRWQPKVQQIWYDGDAEPSSAVLQAFAEADLVVICPSNPILSIEPILALGDLKTRLAKRRVPAIALSPLIGGKAVKGPADKLMIECGFEASNKGVWAFYDELIDALVVDESDIPSNGVYFATSILMKTPQDRQVLARQVLEFAQEIKR